MMNKKLHKWLSLIVGVQLLVWLSTGLYFNLMDHKKASGNINRITPVVSEKLSDFTLFPVVKLSLTSFEKLGIVWLQNTPHYLVTLRSAAHSYQKQQQQIFNAVTGNIVMLDEVMASDIAMASYRGEGFIDNAVLLQAPISDLPKQENAVWQIDVDDQFNTSIYVSNSTGQVIAHITDDRRLKDLMFMLHFMDYTNEGSFNNWQIIVFALLTLLLSLTGAIWVVQLIKQKAYTFTWIKGTKEIIIKRRKNDITRAVNEVNTQQLEKNKTLLDALEQVGIELPSRCGGGGTCGCCMFTTSNELPINIAEKSLLTSEQQQQGVRLACQQHVKNIKSIYLE